MSIAAVVAVLVPIAMVVVLVWVLLAALGAASTARHEIVVSRDELDAVSRLRRRGLIVDTVAVLAGAGVALAAITGRLDGLPGLSLGRGSVLGLGVGALTGVAIICIGELTAPRPTGRLRTAGLASRSPAGFLRRGPALVTAGGMLVLGLLMVAGTLMASPDDMGRAGRSIASRCVGPDGSTVGGSHGPFPGSFYTVPVAVAVVVLLGLVWITLRTVARRPSLGADSAALDAALRRVATTRVVAGLGVAAWGTATLLGLAMLGGVSAMREPREYGVDGRVMSVSCAPGWFAPLQYALFALAVASVFFALWCLVDVVSGGRRRELRELEVRERHPDEVSA